MARDCRASYRSIGSQSGLTSKSIKARVKNMVRSGIIEKFIVRVNPAGFGYRTAYVLIRNNGISKEDVIDRVKQFGDLAYHVHHIGRTSMAALIIKKEPLNDKIVQSLNDSLKPASVNGISVSELPVSSSSTNLSETDLRIIKCLLLLGARMEISEIAKELGISEKTTTRRLDRMKEGRLLEFSLQCDPSSMVGYVQFTILINVEKSHYRDVYERIYEEFQENILYRPSIIDPNDRLIFVLYGDNVFMVDFVLAKVDFLEGVKNVDVYILSKLQYYNDWIIREVDERLVLQQPPLA
ncbi:MAG: Lrp/AsnC family transcriptional regulator [Nitrososphaeraceae archaeon]|nr:Lrp/AsnC family transcriptional regulator [Nitrososphaeraceae archaeon]